MVRLRWGLLPLIGSAIDAASDDGRFIVAVDWPATVAPYGCNGIG